MRFLQVFWTHRLEIAGFYGLLCIWCFGVEDADAGIISDRASGMKTLSALVTKDEVAELTGYHRKTILRYVQRKYIYGVNMMGKYYISKNSIINYLATR